MLLPSSGWINFNEKLTFMMTKKKEKKGCIWKNLVKTHDHLCKLLQTCRSLTEKILNLQTPTNYNQAWVGSILKGCEHTTDEQTNARLHCIILLQ